MSALRDITGDYLKLMVMLEEEPDSEETLEFIKDTLEGVEGEFGDKIEKYVYVIKEYEAQIEAIKKEMERLSQRKKVVENSIERLKNAIKGAMEVTQTTKCGGNLYTVTLKKGIPQLEIIDEKIIPKKYFNKIPATLKLDKRKLLEDAKLKLIEGVELKTSNSLLIK